jgi:hypothetical protein
MLLINGSGLNVSTMFLQVYSRSIVCVQNVTELIVSENVFVREADLVSVTYLVMCVS